MAQSNPENTVGVMTMAGKGVRVLVTPTSDLGKILACMHGKLTSIPKSLLYYSAGCHLVLLKENCVVPMENGAS